MIKKLKNRKGFTLIELIVTIAIVALVMGLTTFGILSIVDASKTQKMTISRNSITAAANTYSTGADTGWKRPYDQRYNYDAFCVTVGELVNKGLLENDIGDASGKKRTDFVIIKRDRTTLAISEKKFAETKDEKDVCLGNITHPDVKVEAPQIQEEKTKSYTDRATVTFKKGKAYDEAGTSIEIEDKGHRCIYCTDSNCFDQTSVYERSVSASDSSSDEMTCTIPDVNDSKLKAGTTYYVIARFYYTVDGNAKQEGSEPAEVTTKTLKEPVIKQSGKTVQITYDDTDIRAGQAKHYFKSEKSGTVNKDVFACKSVSNGIGEGCTTKTRTLEAGKWYELQKDTDVTITYGDIETSKVSAEISDGTNFKDKDFVFKLKKVTVKFYKNYATNIGGSTSEYKEVSCYAEEGKSCNITAPSITAPNNYKVVGYSTSSSGTTSTWNVGAQKSFSTNQNYYAIVSRTLTVNFYRNGVYMLDNSTSTYVSKECTLYNGDSYCGVTSPEIKVTNGSKIIGYNTSSDGTYSQCDSKSSCNVSKDTNYYAIVEANRTITVYFSANYAQSIGKTEESCTVAAGADGCNITLPSITPRRLYSAIGWSQNSSSKTGTAAGTRVYVTDTRYYYAITKRDITLQFVDDSGNNTPFADFSACTMYNDDQSCSYDLSGPSSQFTRSGYTLSSWRDNYWKTYPTTGYSAFSDSTVLHAQWSSGGGSVTPPNPGGGSSDNEVINDYRYACVNDPALPNDTRTAIYYVTTCSKSTGKCKYTTKNTLNIFGYPQSKDIEGNPSGEINKSALSTTYTSCDNYKFSVDKNPTADGNNGVLYCYSSPSTGSSKVMSYVGCSTIDYIYKITLTGPNWYWEPSANCFMPGTNLNNWEVTGCSETDKRNLGSGGGGAACDRTTGLKCCWGPLTCYTDFY